MCMGYHNSIDFSQSVFWEPFKGGLKERFSNINGDDPTHEDQGPNKYLI